MMHPAGNEAFATLRRQFPGKTTTGMGWKRRRAVAALSGAVAVSLLNVPDFLMACVADLMRTPQGCQVVIPKGSVPICGGARALARFNALIALNGEAA